MPTSLSLDGAVSSLLPPDLDVDLLRDVLAEGRECVAAAEASLLALEHTPDDVEAVNTALRAFHTVKATSAFIGLTRLTAVAHEAESLLARVRDREVAYAGACAALSLRSVDMVKALLDAADAAAVPNDDAAGAESSVRVRTDRLDRLIDLVGELAIAQALITGDAALAGGQHHELTGKIAHAGHIVRELQELSASMRMVPLKATFQKLARLVRDVAAKLGKEVDFVTAGEDAEIDRNMADVIGDPLIHMIRNALDHGVEPPDEREAVGKPRRGRVRLSAHQAGGGVVVELQDDGRGLLREKIARKAIERRLIDSDEGMSDGDVFALIFAPGFSTAEGLTVVSGRGVGMDVVRRNVESVRGRVEIASTPGQGTTFSVHLPGGKSRHR